MNTKRVTLWHDLSGDKYIITLSNPNRSVNKLKERPFAYQIKSRKLNVTPEIEEYFRQEFDELIYL